MTTQAGLKKLTLMRQGDAKALFDAKRYPGAFYISGLAVECGIKVIIASQFKRNHVPAKSLANGFYEHDAEKLIGLAGLKNELALDLQANRTFFGYWNVVKDWKIDCRYDHAISKADASEMLIAVNDPADGVISWLQRRW